MSLKAQRDIVTQNQNVLEGSFKQSESASDI